MCFHHQWKSITQAFSVEPKEWRQPDRVMHVATNISSPLRVLGMIPDSWVIWGNLGVDIWDVPEVLVGKHPFGHILAELHRLFSDVLEEGVA
jgi:hypothetical protein